MVVPETATWNFDEQYDYAPGQVAPQLWGRALVRAQAIGVPRKPLEELAGRQWREQLPSNIGRVGAPKVAGEPALQETTDDYLVVSLPMEGTVAPHFDGAALAEQFRGQSADAVRARLASLPGLQGTPQIETWPAWAPAALRVDVKVQ